MVRANLCIIEDSGKALMKLATRGVMKGKWNFPGGKIDEGETPEESVVREVREETGLTVKDARHMGLLEFYNKDEPFFSVEVYVTSEFSGELTESEEGQLKWFGTEEIPFDRMSEADRFWVPLVMGGKAVEGEFHFENANTDKLISHSVKERGAE